MNGIDVSSYQGRIDWDAVKAAGIAFAVIRGGYGNEISQKDKRFEENMQGALVAGLHVGAYWFSYAYNVDMARQEAAIFAQVMEPYKGRADFPLCFDWEYDSDKYARKNGVTADSRLITDMAAAFLEALEGAGWYAANYTNQDYYKNKFDSGRMKPYDLWLADYTGGPEYPCGIQQTGSRGRVAGISGNVDTDTAFKDYPSIIRAAGLNGFRTGTAAPTAPKPAPVPTKPTAPAVQTRSYTVKLGDSLSVIGEKLGISWRTIAALNDLTSPYTIYAGQTLELPGNGGAAQLQKPQTKTYTVKQGDCLSTIGAKLGIPWRTIAAMNGISSPYIIHAGQTLKLPG